MRKGLSSILDVDCIKSYVTNRNDLFSHSPNTSFNACTRSQQKCVHSSSQEDAPVLLLDLAEGMF